MTPLIQNMRNVSTTTSATFTHQLMMMTRAPTVATLLFDTTMSVK